MCGRLACTLAPNDLVSACCYMNEDGQWKKPSWISSSYEYKPFYNGPPTTVVGVLAHKNHFPEKNFELSEDICLVAMRWGMLPTFKAEVTGNYHTHNARIETITKSPIYKPCLTSGQRCIIVAEGFYEWQTTQGEKNKQPYFIYQENEFQEDKLKGKEEIWKGKYLVKFAGLFNIVMDDVIKYTCTIMTKESDKSISWMHHRMPVVLNTANEINQWLHYEKHPYMEALNNFTIVEDVPQTTLNHYAVNKQYVNNSSFNDIKCMQRLSVKRKNTLYNWLESK